METVGHHTCKKDGGEAFVLANAPFLSEFVGDSKPFLGEGYYFWDYDLVQAKSWGRQHYNDSYFVVRANLLMPDDAFLDLAGTRRHMIHFLQLMERFKPRKINAEEMEIGKFIEFMKEYSKADPSVFPYLVIRAEDYSAQPIVKYYFSEKKNFTVLNARFVICYLNKDPLYLRDLGIVYVSK